MVARVGLCLTRATLEVTRSDLSVQDWLLGIVIELESENWLLVRLGSW